MRTRHPSLCLLLALALVAGCAGKTRTTYEVAGADAAALRAGGLAVGGMVLGARLAAEPRMRLPEDIPAGDVLAQCEALAPVLYRHLLVRAEGATVWSWPVVRGAAPDSLVAPVLAAVARGGVLRPAGLDEAAPAAGGVRYLAFARVDGNEVTMHGGEGELTDPDTRRGESDIHGDRRTAFTKTRRTVTVVMDVYDRQSGRVVRTVTSERRRDRLLSAHETMLLREREPGTLIEGTTARVPAPPFADVLEDACAALAEALLPTAPRAGQEG